MGVLDRFVQVIDNVAGHDTALDEFEAERTAWGFEAVYTELRLPLTARRDGEIAEFLGTQPQASRRFAGKQVAALAVTSGNSERLSAVRRAHRHENLVQRNQSVPDPLEHTACDRFCPKGARSQQQERH